MSETYRPEVTPVMTLRDYFAAAYLNGAAANPECHKVGETAVANAAYVVADAMLKARDGK